MRSRRTPRTEDTAPPRSRRWRISGVSHATVVAYVALFMAMSGTAVAATGGSFILGKSNSASSVTSLTSSTGPALSLRAPAGTAPLQVNRSLKVDRLNADLLDGVDATGFARIGTTSTGARTTLANPDGVPLRLTSKAGSAPLQVTSSAKVGNLNADLLDGFDSDDFVATTPFEELRADHAALKAKHATLQAQYADLASQIADLQKLVTGISREKVGGRDTLRFSGLNLQLVNGTGKTDGRNGLGNLIVGYNALPVVGDAARTGSHYLVVGDGHGWTSSGGIIGGESNTASGKSASVIGGTFNTASGVGAIVTGGSNNTASGWFSSVSGGTANTASGDPSSSWWMGDFTAVSGGRGNTAIGVESSILGGYGHKLTANGACAPACS